MLVYHVNKCQYIKYITVNKYHYIMHITVKSNK